VTWMTKRMKRPYALRLPPSQWCVHCTPKATSSAQPSLQVPAPVLPPVEPTDEIRLAGTILSVVGTMIVVQVSRTAVYAIVRTLTLFFKASKDDALLDDGSTICFEDRSPLGQVLLLSSFSAL